MYCNMLIILPFIYSHLKIITFVATSSPPPPRPPQSILVSRSWSAIARLLRYGLQLLKLTEYLKKRISPSLGWQ